MIRYPLQGCFSFFLFFKCLNDGGMTKTLLILQQIQTSGVHHLWGLPESCKCWSVPRELCPIVFGQIVILSGFPCC